MMRISRTAIIFTTLTLVASAIAGCGTDKATQTVFTEKEQIEAVRSSGTICESTADSTGAGAETAAHFRRHFRFRKKKPPRHHLTNGVTT